MRKAVSQNYIGESLSPTATAALAEFPNAITARERKAIAKAVDLLKFHSLWDGVRTLQIYAMQDATNALVDIKNISDATLVSAPMHTPGRGFRTNGTSSYINTNFAPSVDGGTLFTQDNGFVAIFLKKNNSTGATGTVLGAFTNATQRINLSQVPTTNSYFFRVNNASGTTHNNGSLGNHTRINAGLTMIARVNPTTTRLLINGTSVQSGTENATALSTHDISIGGLNNAGTVSGFMDVEVGLFVAGSFSGISETASGKMQKFNDILTALMCELETGYPDWAQFNIGLWGQSNAAGEVTDSALPTQTPVDLRSPILNTEIRIGSGAFAQLDYPTNNQGNTFGIELTLCYALQDFYGKSIVISKVAENGAPLASEAGRNDFWPLNAELYPTYRDSLIDMHIKAHQADRIPINIAIQIGMERDTNTDAMADAALSNLYFFYNSLAMAVAPVTYIVTNKIHPGITASGVNGPRLTRVNNALVGFTEMSLGVSKLMRMDYNHLTDSFAALGSDNLHYPGAYYEMKGYHAAEIIKSFTQ